MFCSQCGRYPRLLLGMIESPFDGFATCCTSSLRLRHRCKHFGKTAPSLPRQGPPPGRPRYVRLPALRQVRLHCNSAVFLACRHRTLLQDGLFQKCEAGFAVFGILGGSRAKRKRPRRARPLPWTSHFWSTGGRADQAIISGEKGRRTDRVKGLAQCRFCR